MEDSNEDGVGPGVVCSTDVVSGAKLSSMLDEMLSVAPVMVLKDSVTSLLTVGIAVVSGAVDTAMEEDGVGVDVGVEPRPVTPITEEVDGMNTNDVTGSEGVIVMVEGKKTNDDSLETVIAGLLGVTETVVNGAIVDDCRVSIDTEETTAERIELVIGNMKVVDGSTGLDVGVTCSDVEGGKTNSDDREMVGS